MHTHGFAGMTQEQSWPLIDELTAIATDDRFTYYHHWQVGDVLMWDERATMHRGAGDANPEERRVMLRTIVYPHWTGAEAPPLRGLTSKEISGRNTNDRAARYCNHLHPVQNRRRAMSRFGWPFQTSCRDIEPRSAGGTMTKVFIAGHGRMSLSGAMAVPAGVTLHWAVPPRYNGSGGLSRAFLSKTYETWAGSNARGSPDWRAFPVSRSCRHHGNEGRGVAGGRLAKRQHISAAAPTEIHCEVEQHYIVLEAKTGNASRYLLDVLSKPGVAALLSDTLLWAGPGDRRTCGRKHRCRSGRNLRPRHETREKARNRREAFEFPTGKTAVCITDIAGGVTMLPLNPTPRFPSSYPGPAFCFVVDVSNTHVRDEKAAVWLEL